ncbi:MAG: cytochrome-c peroxidase [Cytophagales bacterium]|nr:cytochrome-c peroxidase [Cytophagales bacterium]
MIILGFASSCAEPEEVDPKFVIDVPSHLGEMPVRAENPLTLGGIALGKKLFFDPSLSSNNQVSCATCHLPSLAFSDGVSLSDKGVSGEQMIRNSPALFNLAWHQGYFWEGGANDLASQAFGPLTHPDEMGSNLNEILEKLRGNTEYVNLFKENFPQGISSQSLAFALEQYQLSLISAESPYDDYITGKSILSEEEVEGLKIFTEKCGSCHEGNHFSDFKYHRNGIDSVWNYASLEDARWGRFRITFDSTDIGKYKTPSLRNITLTAPYMHDGRFQNLEEVLTHYQTQFSITEQEKSRIIKFLDTLTDEKFIQKHSQN